MTKRTKYRPNGQQIDTEELVSAGFIRLEKDFSNTPPRIKWGQLYNGRAQEHKIPYLEKLAAAMNHAAFIIQNERDQLGMLVELKEKKITSMKVALAQNNVMIQQEITRMNADRQKFHEEISSLRAQLRELQHGDQH